MAQTECSKPGDDDIWRLLSIGGILTARCYCIGHPLFIWTLKHSLQHVWTFYLLAADHWARMSSLSLVDMRPWLLGNKVTASDDQAGGDIAKNIWIAELISFAGFFHLKLLREKIFATKNNSSITQKNSLVEWPFWLNLTHHQLYVLCFLRLSLKGVSWFRRWLRIPSSWSPFCAATACWCPPTRTQWPRCCDSGPPEAQRKEIAEVKICEAPDLFQNIRFFGCWSWMLMCLDFCWIGAKIFVAHLETGLSFGLSPHCSQRKDVRDSLISWELESFWTIWKLDFCIFLPFSNPTGTRKGD